MRRFVPLVLLLPLLACRATSAVASEVASDGASAGPPLSHGVFFTVADHEDVDDLVADCAALVAATDGVLAHAVGPRLTDLARPINDQDFDVGLWLLFEDRAAHDAYQVSAAHLALIERWMATLTDVRVFDHAGQGTERGE